MMIVFTTKGDRMFTTPFEIDTELARLYGEAEKVRMQIGYAADGVHHLANDEKVKYGRARWEYRAWKMTLDECLAIVNAEGFEASPSHWAFREYPAKLIEERANLAAIDEQMAPLNAAYLADPWSRFFIVPGGHIHSSMECSTCNNGQLPTQFGWLPQLSGKNEAEAVADQGALLCTVCFPSAPVEWTNFYEEQEAAKKAAQCPGSGTYDYPRETARMGFYAGNYGVCNQCGEHVSITKTNKLRAHKPK